jgi:hypothetical protein
VSVLKLYPAYHFGNLEQMPEAGRPVRDGQASIVAGDQPTGNDQQESQRGNKNGKPMMDGVIRGRGQNCSLRVLVILSLALITPDKYKGFETQNTKPLKHREGSNRRN